VSSPFYAGSQGLAESIEGSLADVDGQPTPDRIIRAIEDSSQADTVLVYLISSEIRLPGGILSIYDFAQAVSACEGEVIVFDLASDVGMVGSLGKYLSPNAKVIEYDSYKAIPHRVYGNFADLQNQIAGDAGVTWNDIQRPDRSCAPSVTLYLGSSVVKDTRRVPSDHAFFQPITQTLGIR
jgi:hypothetical protein